MRSHEEFNDKKWPPGTVLLEDLAHDGEIILQPHPSIDPNDPLNWPLWRKYWNFVLAFVYAIFVFANIDITTVTWGPMHSQLGFSYDTLNNSYAAGCAALSVGGPLLIPFALKFGRRPIYVLSTACQLALAIWSAKISTVGDLMATNTLNCLFGALAECIVQMTVADVFFVHQRGRMNSMFCWAMTIGSSMLPMIAGYIARDHGWRWVWWLMTIAFAIMLPVYLFCFEESSYSGSYDGMTVVELRDDSAGDTKLNTLGPIGTAVDSNPAKFAITNEERRADDVKIDHTIPSRTYMQRLALWSPAPGPFSIFFRHSYQPLVVFAKIPAVFYMCLVYTILNATVTVKATILAQLMPQPPYNFDPAQVGLMSLASFIGTTLGLIICGPLSDWIILYLAKKNRGIYEPEMRLWVMAAFVPFVPAGLLMSGFGLANGSSWLVIVFGSGLLAFGNAPISSISLTYLTDSYTGIVADTMVALTITRNIVATAFVFAIDPWIAGIGIKSVFVMLTVFNIVILGSVFIFIFFGKKSRIKTAVKYRHYAQLQHNPRGT